jgi:hypothetical protein
MITVCQGTMVILTNMPLGVSEFGDALFPHVSVQYREIIGVGYKEKYHKGRVERQRKAMRYYGCCDDKPFASDAAG